MYLSCSRRLGRECSVGLYFSLQEVLNDSSGDGDSGTTDVEVLKGCCGRGRHLVFIDPSRLGHHRVAVVVHRRWSRCVCATRVSGRSISVTLRSHNDGRLQVISSHLPSSIGCTLDGYEHHVCELSELIRGTRRCKVLTGMDANKHIGKASALQEVSGTALGDASNEMGGHRMKFLNTFESWWRATASSFPSSSSTPTRWAWSGHIFDTFLQRPSTTCSATS